jgi:selenocysteine lyase/cysteine desulfurase
LAGVPAPEVRNRLRDKNVTVTVSGVTSTRYDMERRGLDEIVRASPHYFVSPTQLDKAVAAVAELG